MRFPRTSSLHAVALALGVLLSATRASAQGVGALSGRVTRDGGQAVAGATVRVDQTARSATTDVDGRFRLDSIVAGFHRVDVAAIGYAPATKRVLVNTGSATTTDFVMQSRAVALEAFNVRGEAVPGSMRPADDLQGNILTVGAKSEVVEVSQMNGNLAEKTPRQIFARVPGGVRLRHGRLGQPGQRLHAWPRRPPVVGDER